MAKIDAMTINKWTLDCEDWLLRNTVGATRFNVETGEDAWTVAHWAGIVREAYALGQGIHAAHIQTALEKIFPNAFFS